jgi:hypothetical protein
MGAAQALSWRSPASSLLILHTFFDGQRVSGEAQIFDDVPADQVFLDDALGILGSNISIPRTFRIHDADRTARADAQALALRAIEGAIRTGNVQFLHSPLQVQPRSFAIFEVRAIGAQANEEMPCQTADAKHTRCLGRLIRSLCHVPIIAQPWHRVCSVGPSAC